MSSNRHSLLNAHASEAFSNLVHLLLGKQWVPRYEAHHICKTVTETTNPCRQELYMYSDNSYQTKYKTFYTTVDACKPTSRDLWIIWAVPTKSAVISEAFCVYQKIARPFLYSILDTFLWCRNLGLNVAREKYGSVNDSMHMNFLNIAKLCNLGVRSGAGSNLKVGIMWTLRFSAELRCFGPMQIRKSPFGLWTTSRLKPTASAQWQVR